MSAFVAAFFAFWEIGLPQTEFRAIFAVNKDKIQSHCQTIESRNSRIPQVVFLSPLSDDNARLTNQGGLFSKLPIEIDLEAWLSAHHSQEWSTPVFYKFRISNSEAMTTLRSLAQMNINGLTLFPDLIGSALFCNAALRQEGYTHPLGTPPPRRMPQLHMH